MTDVRRGRRKEKLSYNITSDDIIVYPWLKSLNSAGLSSSYCVSSEVFIALCFMPIVMFHNTISKKIRMLCTRYNTLEIRVIIFPSSYCGRKEVNDKINMFQRMCCTISRTLKGKTQLSTQNKFYKVMAVPVLMYGSENWSLNRSDKRKLKAAEMRFLRPTAGYTLLDKERSSDIREQLGIFNILRTN